MLVDEQKTIELALRELCNPPSQFFVHIARIVGPRRHIHEHISEQTVPNTAGTTRVRNNLRRFGSIEQIRNGSCGRNRLLDATLYLRINRDFVDRTSKNGPRRNGGEGWIRTSVRLRGQIYSLLPLTTRPPLHEVRQARHVASRPLCVNAPKRLVAPLGYSPRVRSNSSACPRHAGVGAGEGNRTLVVSLEGFCSTIELHPRLGGGANAIGTLSQSTAPYRKACSRPLPSRIYSVWFATTGERLTGARIDVWLWKPPLFGSTLISVPSELTRISLPPARTGPR